MAANQSETRQLLRARAHALASMYLSRRKGAKVEEVTGDLGIDLLVTFPNGRKPGLRQLGVELRYAMEPTAADRANQQLRPTWQKAVSYGPFPFPVVLFFFTMRDDGGWYAWVAEPVVTAEGKAQLPLRPEPDCSPLTDESLEELFDRVNHWYDVHYSEIAPVTPVGKRSKKS